MKNLTAIACALCLWCMAAGPAHAHWSNPGYLEFKQTTTETYSVLWKVPLLAGRPLRLTPALPNACAELTQPASRKTDNAVIQRWMVRCEGGLNNNKVTIVGLPDVQNDVLVRVNQKDGTVQTVRLKGDQNEFKVSTNPSWTDVAHTYLVLGVEHILSGIDHLLFVLALLIIVNGWRRLVATITAFTIAHSLTLGAAVLGFVSLARPPVEAVIALSILFLAVEIRHRARGRVGITERAPWVVAFSFGLLHGFGFAGALTEVGLPQNAIPLALLFFNLGVEIGQLLFVGVFVGLKWAWTRVPLPHFRWIETATVYMIGSVAAFWTIERVAVFFSLA